MSNSDGESIEQKDGQRNRPSPGSVSLQERSGSFSPSSKMFRVAADQIPVLVWQSNAEMRTVYFNQTWLEFTGRTLEQEIGDGWMDGIHPEDVGQIFEHCTPLFNARENFTIEYRLLCADGRYRWMLGSGTPQFDANGEFKGYIGSAVDITERVAAENALRDSEERFRLLVNHAPVCIHELDLNGRIIFINSFGLQMLGVSREADALGFQYLNGVREDDRDEIENLLRRAIEGHASQFEFHGAQQMESRHFSSCFIPIKNSKGAVIKLMGISEDITDQKRAVQQLLQSERLAAIGEAMTGLTHESRNALARSEAELRMLSRRVWDRDDYLEFIERALLAQSEVQKLFERVREYASPPKTAFFQPCNLRRILIDSWDRAVSNHQHDSVQFREEEAVDVICEVDEFAVGQVFRNLFENALAACGDRGLVEVKYAAKKLQGADHILVSINNDGPALPNGLREQIFKPFFTTKTHGTGLGLAIAKRIMNEHRGKIQVESDGRSGVTFHLTFPVRHHD